MKLVFSDDFVRHAIISDERGNVLYQVTTPREALGTPRKSTVWKAIQNTSRESDETLSDIDASSLNYDGRVRELEQMLEHHGFKRLGEIEWHVCSPSKLRMFGGTSSANDLSGERIGSNEFIPAKGGLRRCPTASVSSKVQMVTPITGSWVALNARYIATMVPRTISPLPSIIDAGTSGLSFIQTQDKGYLEINVTLQPSMGIDKKFTDSFSAFESDIADSATVKSVAASSATDGAPDQESVVGTGR